MLLNCNLLSTSRLKLASEEFKKHTKLLAEMKKDLDYIFKKIRVIKAKVSTQYPEAFAEVNCANKTFAEEAEEDEEMNQAASKATQQKPSPAVSAKPPKLSSEKRASKEVGYVKMDQSPDGRPGAETEKRQSFVSNKSTSTDNSNDSSDSDTGWIRIRRAGLIDGLIMKDFLFVKCTRDVLAFLFCKLLIVCALNTAYHHIKINLIKIRDKIIYTFT